MTDEFMSFIPDLGEKATIHFIGAQNTRTVYTNSLERLSDNLMGAKLLSGGVKVIINTKQIAYIN